MQDRRGTLRPISAIRPPLHDVSSQLQTYAKWICTITSSHAALLTYYTHYLVCGGDELPCVAEDEEPADVERDGGQLLLAALVDLTLGRRPL